MGCGPGCGTTSCYDCDGTSGRAIPYGPIDALRQAKRNLVCGGGCGETYVGEWRSTPPDACDPCCGDQFVGGATPCRPFCWQPGALLSTLPGLYGGRFCSGAESSVDCGCATDCCDGGCGVVGGEVYDSGVISGGEVISGGGGCASCGTGGCATCSGGRMSGRPVGSIGQSMRDAGMNARINRIRR